MVKAVRDVEKALGIVNYALSDKTKKSREFARSLFAVKDIADGETITVENVRSIRPGFGLHPKYLSDILGRKVNRDIKKGTPMQWVFVRE